MTTKIPLNGPLPRSTWVSRHQKETFTHSLCLWLLYTSDESDEELVLVSMWLMCCVFQERRTTAASRSLTACLPMVSLNLVS